MNSVHEAGRVVGRYVLYDEIASGGMATIHLGRMLGQAGFARTVAIKRLHPHFAKDPEFVAMFIDEARLAAGIRHPNVVSTLDVVALEGDLFLVMEYVEGDSLSHLVKRVRARDQHIPPAVVSGVVSNVLYGLHAAHTAKDDRGDALSIVHRDISPQNILVGIDGVARVVDFGVAKAARRIMETEAGRIKGKFRYMAPEQVRADKFDHRVDVFAAGIVLWEALTGRGLFMADEPMRTMTLVLEHPIEPPSSLVPGLSNAVDEIVLRALNRSPAERYQNARDMAIDLENALPPAVPRVIGEWVDALVGETLRTRAARLIELGSESNASSAGPMMSVELPLPAVAGEAAAASSPSAAAEPSARARVATAPASGSMAAAGSAPARPVPAVEPVVPVGLPFTPAVPADGTPVSVVGMRKEPSSQISEVSATAWNTAAQRSLFPAHRNRQLKIVLASVAASMTVFLVVLLVFLRARSARDEAPDVQGVVPTGAARGVAEPVAPQPVAPTPEPVAPAAPPPSLEPPPPKVVPQPEAKADPPKPSPKPTGAVDATSVAPGPQKPTPKPAGDCNPPWTVDANGIKKFKRNCM